MMKRISLLATALAATFAVTAVFSAPHNGDEFHLAQPDGSLVRVLVWGDEFQQTVESPDGFTLIRDTDGWICYAKLSVDGNEYVATGTRYTGSTGKSPVSQKNLRINEKSYAEKHRRNREAMGFDNEKMLPRGTRRNQATSRGFAPAPADDDLLPVQGKVVGLSLLVDFPDVTTDVTTATMTDFLNKKGGVGGGGLAISYSLSLRDWFYDASNGTLDYTNKVVPFIRAPRNKDWYDIADRERVKVFLDEIFAELQTRITNNTAGFGDALCEISTEDIGDAPMIMATNIFYAGSPAAGWANGLWPHAGNYSGVNRYLVIPAGRCGAGTAQRTVRIIPYQLTYLGLSGSSPPLTTTIHENGHMLMKWPDLYAYDRTVSTNAVGGYCTMGSGGTTPPNPYFRYLANWITVTDITNMNAVLTHTANIAQTAGIPEISMTRDAYMFRRDAQEFYFIEARRQVGHGAFSPGEGLLIWHIHTRGTNTTLNPANPYPLVKLVQADDPNSTLNTNAVANFPLMFPRANAPFRADGGSNNTAFHATTSPPARYYDGQMSSMRITEISALGPTMTFRVSTDGTIPTTCALTVLNGNFGSGDYAPGTTVTIGAPRTNYTNRANHEFVRWASDALTPANPFACTTTVTMGSEAAFVTAHFGRVNVLPGIVEADTFGYASGIRVTNYTNATGTVSGRAARAAAAGDFAEYPVNVTSAGSYRLTYHIQGSTANSFVLRNVTANAILDTVTMPGGNMQTVTGKTVNLSAGKAIWRIEALTVGTGNILIDWFSVQPSGVTSIQRNPLNPVTPYDIRAASSGKITFQIPAAGHVSLKLYDIKGRMVATLCDGMRAPGVYSVKIAGRNAALGQGVYLLRMKSGAYSKDVRVHYRR